MDLSVARDELLSMLKAAAKAMPNTASRPVTENCRIRAEDGAVRVAGTNLSQYVELQGPAMISRPGTACVDPDRLRAALKTTDVETVRLLLESEEEDGEEELVVRAGGTWWQFYIADPDMWTYEDEGPEEYPVSVSAIALQGAVDRVAYARAEEKGRYALNGLLVELMEGGGGRLTAADGAVLARTSLETESSAGEDRDFIVPAEAFELVLEGCTGSEIELAVRENTLYLRADGVRVNSQLVEGQFPNVDGVIPSEDDRTRVIVEAERLARAFRQAQVVTTESTRAVSWQLRGEGGKQSLFDAESPEIGESRVEMEYTSFEGDPSAIVAFNPAYMVDICDHAEEEEIALHVGGRRDPVLIRSGEHTTVVLSPIVQEEAE